MERFSQILRFFSRILSGKEPIERVWKGEAKFRKWLDKLVFYSIQADQSDLLLSCIAATLELQLLARLLSSW